MAALEVLEIDIDGGIWQSGEDGVDALANCLRLRRLVLNSGTLAERFAELLSRLPRLAYFQSQASVLQLSVSTCQWLLHSSSLRLVAFHRDRGPWVLAELRGRSRAATLPAHAPAASGLVWYEGELVRPPTPQRADEAKARGARSCCVVM